MAVWRPGLFTYGSNKNSQLGHEDSEPSPVEGLENVRQADSKGSKELDEFWMADVGSP